MKEGAKKLLSKLLCTVGAKCPTGALQIKDRCKQSSVSNQPLRSRRCRPHNLFYMGLHRIAKRYGVIQLIKKKKKQQITFNYFISSLYSKGVADRLMINVVDHDQLTFNLLWTEIQLNGHYVTPSSSPSGLLLFKRLYKSSNCIGDAQSDILYTIKTIPRYSVPMRATFWVWNRKLHKAKKFTQISTSYRYIKSNSLFSFYQTGLTENFNEQQYTHIRVPEIDASSCTLLQSKTLLCTSGSCFARSRHNYYNAQFTTHNTHASGGATFATFAPQVIGVRRCKEELTSEAGGVKSEVQRLCIFDAEQNLISPKELTSEAHMKDVSDKLLTPCFYILNVYTKQKNVLLSTLNKPFNWHRNPASISKRKIIITSLASGGHLWGTLHLRCTSAIKADVMVHSRSSASNQFLRKCKFVQLHSCTFVLRTQCASSEFERSCIASSILHSARLCIESAPKVHCALCIVHCKRQKMEKLPFLGLKRFNSIINHGTSCIVSAPINVCFTCSNSLGEWRSVKEATINLALPSKLELSARIAIGRFFAPSITHPRWKSCFLRDSAWQTDKPSILDPRIALKANKKKKDTNKLVNIFYKFDKLERDKKEIYWPLIISFLPKAIQRRFVKLFLVNQNLKQVRYSQIEQFLSIIKKF